MLKKSKYNYVVEKDERIYVYNFLYRSFLKIDKKQWENSDFNQLTIDTLMQYGILLDETIDEYVVLRNLINVGLYSKKHISIFLSMTSQCNFNCPYCYQDYRKDMKENIFIEKEKVDSLYNYLYNQIKKENTEHLSIVFFGGEPCLDDEKLLYAIDKLNSLQSIEKYFCIITNGYNITKKLIDKMEEIENFSIQITLDGYGEVHDKSRPLKNGSSTFINIYENIKKLGQRNINNIAIRVNVDLDIVDNYYDMVDKMAKDGMDKNISLLEFIAIFNGQKKKNCNNLKQQGDREIQKLNEYARKKGFVTGYNVITGPCMTHSSCCFAVDENLNVYNCPGSLYSNSTAHITSEGHFIVDDGMWHTDIFTTKECIKTCIYAPICYGGCTMNDSCNKQAIESKLPFFIQDKIEKYNQDNLTRVV